MLESSSDSNQREPQNKQHDHDYSWTEIPPDQLEKGDEDLVLFRGEKLMRGWPEKLEISQKILHLTLPDGRVIPRIKWGDHPYKWNGLEEGKEKWPCYHCSAQPDEYHVLGCDYESCPNCEGQLVSCACSFCEIPHAADEILNLQEEITDELSERLGKYPPDGWSPLHN